MPENIFPVHDFTYEGAQVRIYHANKGQGLAKHQHVTSHATYCANGSIVVRVQSGEYIRDKDSQPANLPANAWHEIEALEDGTVFFNVFAVGKSD